MKVIFAYIFISNIFYFIDHKNESKNHTSNKPEQNHIQNFRRSQLTKSSQNMPILENYPSEISNSTPYYQSLLLNMLTKPLIEDFTTTKLNLNENKLLLPNSVSQPYEYNTLQHTTSPKSSLDFVLGYNTKFEDTFLALNENVVDEIFSLKNKYYPNANEHEYQIQYLIEILPYNTTDSIVRKFLKLSNYTTRAPVKPKFIHWNMTKVKEDGQYFSFPSKNIGGEKKREKVIVGDVPEEDKTGVIVFEEFYEPFPDNYTPSYVYIS